MDVKALADKVWYEHIFTTQEQVESNRRKWRKAVETLGPRWLLMNKVERKEGTCNG